FEAPVSVCWGVRNRSALIRVPGTKPWKEDAARIEYRALDPSANPYLAFSVILAAGLEGIAEGYELGPEAEDNINEMPRADRLVPAGPQGGLAGSGAGGAGGRDRPSPRARARRRDLRRLHRGSLLAERAGGSPAPGPVALPAGRPRCPECPGPRRGARQLPGNPAGDPHRVDLHGVRTAEVPHVASGAGVHPGDPALEGLGLRVLRRRPDGRRPHPAAPGEARRGPRPLHRDRPGSGVPLQPRITPEAPLEALDHPA